MASLEEFLKRPTEGAAATGMKGRESDWLALATFNLRGKRFIVCDAGAMGSEDDGVSIPAAPGKYSVEVKVMEFGDDRRISRLRVKAAGVPVRVELRKVDDAGVDVGRVGFTDADELFKLGDRLESDELIDGLTEALEENDEMFGTHKFPKGPTMIYTESGFGDGTYPVFQLLRDGVSVGFEVELIEVDAEYHFSGRGSGDAGSEPSGPAFSDPATEAIGDLIQSMKAAQTGDREKDKAKFRELMNQKIQEIQGQIDKEASG